MGEHIFSKVNGLLWLRKSASCAASRVLIGQHGAANPYLTALIHWAAIFLLGACP
jgi:hypothetical protein